MKETIRNNSWEIAVVVTVLVAIIGGVFFVGTGVFESDTDDDLSDSIEIIESADGVEITLSEDSDASEVIVTNGDETHTLSPGEGVNFDRAGIGDISIEDNENNRSSSYTPQYPDVPLDFETTTVTAGEETDLETLLENPNALNSAQSVDWRVNNESVDAVHTFSEAGTVDVTIFAGVGNAFLTNSAEVTVQPASATLDISVVDENGDGIENASVSIHEETLQTDTNGTAVFDVEHGEYTIETTVDEQSYTDTVEVTEDTSVEVVHESEQSEDDETEAEEDTVTTTVQNESGTVIEDAQVTVENTDDDVISTGSTDSSGEHQFETTPAELTFTAEATGYETTTETLSIESVPNSVTLTVSEEQTSTKNDLEVSVIDEHSRNSVENASISVVRGGSVIASGTTDRDGVFNTTIEEGPVSIVTEYEDSETETSETVYSDSEVQTTVNAELYGVVSTNPVIENATVSLVSNDDTIASTTTNEHGEYTFDIGVVEEDSSILVNTEADVTVDGVPFYASAERNANTAEAMHFTFDSEGDTVVETEVNQETVLVSYAISEEQFDARPVGNLHQLQAMKEDVEEDYELLADIDASETSNWNYVDETEILDETLTWGETDELQTDLHPIAPDSEVITVDDGDRILDENEYVIDYNTGEITLDEPASQVHIDYNYVFDDELAFIPISYFEGTFDGNGYEVQNLEINNLEMGDVGLFGYTYNAEIHNVGLTNIDVSGEASRETAGLVGYALSGEITNSYTTGTIQGEWAAGFVGTTDGGLVIEDSYSEANVYGEEYSGGFVGLTIGERISNSYATGDVIADGDRVGGFAGSHEGGIIEESYATGNVEGTDDIGGFAGFSAFSGTEINDSHSTGDVTGIENVGGLVGDNSALVEDSFTTSRVTGETNVGGLAGESSDIIRTSYATGTVTGDVRVGGLIGDATRNSEVYNSYTHSDVTGVEEVGGILGNNYTYNDGGSFSGGGEMYNTYATGTIDGETLVGGIVGNNGETNEDGDFIGTVEKSYWDTQETNQTDAIGDDTNSGLTDVQGLETNEMTGDSATENMLLDFTNTWTWVENDYPELQVFAENINDNPEN